MLTLLALLLLCNNAYGTTTSISLIQDTYLIPTTIKQINCNKLNYCPKIIHCYKYTPPHNNTPWKCVALLERNTKFHYQINYFNQLNQFYANIETNTNYSNYNFRICILTTTIIIIKIITNLLHLHFPSVIFTLFTCFISNNTLEWQSNY